jgi:hypothetical protein
VAEAIVIDHLAGARQGQRQTFALVDVVRFGRHPASEVAFDAHRDLDASAHHAELRREGFGYVLLDVGSSNGTFVRGERVSRVELARGVPVEVLFGDAGPRLRIYVGEPSHLVMVPDTVMRPGGSASGLAQAGRPKRATMSMMVAHAKDAAAGQRGVVRSTVFMKDLVDQALHHSTRRFKLLALLIGLLVVAGLAVLIVWNLRLAGRVPVATVVPVAEAGPRIVRENRAALHLLAYVDVDGRELPFCTGFAVARRHLATNAHCVVELERLRGKDLVIFVVENGDAKARRQVVGVTRHPEFRPHGGVSVDVAVIEVDRDLPRRMVLAGEAELRALEPGTTIFTYGFPGRLARPSAPEATLTGGNIGRLTRLDEASGGFADSLLVQHSAFAGEGTSGSPVFDAAGRVIAVNTGSYTGDRAEALSGYNVAIRIDTVAALLSQLGIATEGAGQKTP